MDIVLYEGESIDDITVNGLFISEQPHRVYEGTDGRVIVSVGNMNAEAV